MDEGEKAAAAIAALAGSPIAAAGFAQAAAAAAGSKGSNPWGQARADGRVTPGAAQRATSRRRGGGKLVRGDDGDGGYGTDGCADASPRLGCRDTTNSCSRWRRRVPRISRPRRRLRGPDASAPRGGHLPPQLPGLHPRRVSRRSQRVWQLHERRDGQARGRKARDGCEGGLCHRGHRVNRGSLAPRRRHASLPPPEPRDDSSASLESPAASVGVNDPTAYIQVELRLNPRGESSRRISRLSLALGVVPPHLDARKALVYSRGAFHDAPRLYSVRTLHTLYHLFRIYAWMYQFCSHFSSVSSARPHRLSPTVATFISLLTMLRRTLSVRRQQVKISNTDHLSRPMCRRRLNLELPTVLSTSALHTRQLTRRWVVVTKVRVNIYPGWMIPFMRGARTIFMRVPAPSHFKMWSTKKYNFGSFP